MTVDELAVARNRKKVRKWTWFGVIVSTASLLIWVFYFSNFLVVRDIEVLGKLEHSTADEVLMAADIEMGVQLARLDSEYINQKLTELTSIAAVEIRRVWPDKVILAVTEETPVLVERMGNRWQLVSDKGVRFGFADIRPDGLLEVESRSPSALKEAAKLPNVLPAELKEQIVRIYALTPNDLRFDLVDEKKILWGNAEDSARKAEVLQALFSVKADIYDVSAPDLPVTRRLKN